MNRLLFLFLLLASFPAEARTHHRRHSTSKKTTHTATRASSRRKKPSRRVSPASRSSKKAVSRQPLKAAQTWRNRQQAPSPERYREIQEALAAKGYLKSPPTGVWDPESTAALRKFQEEQNLDSTGRVDSLSLIALGLGPRTEASSKPPTLP